MFYSFLPSFLLAGKWPFWLSPRQCIVIPVDPKFCEYAERVQQLVHEAGFYVDVDDSQRTLNKKVRYAGRSVVPACMP